MEPDWERSQRDVNVCRWTVSDGLCPGDALIGTKKEAVYGVKDGHAGDYWGLAVCASRFTQALERATQGATASDPAASLNPAAVVTPCDCNFRVKPDYAVLTFGGTPSLVAPVVPIVWVSVRTSP